MKRSLLVFTAMASLVLPALAPVAAVAQNRGEQEGGRGQRVQRSQEPRAQAPRQNEARTRSPQPGPDRRSGASSRPQEQAQERQQRPERPAAVQRPDAGTPQARPERSERPAVRPEGNRWECRGRDPNRQDRPELNRPDRPANSRPDRPGVNRPDRPDRPDRPKANRPDRNDRPGANRPDRQDRPGASRPDRRPGQYQQRPNRPGHNVSRRDYREFHNRWNRDRWQREWNNRQRADWWRSDNRFRSWSGIRVGYYFAPGYGYYNVPSAYWNRHYQVGQYLPEVFWRYQVNEWRTYGLGYPPAGTRWVYVDNAIYLIDEYDGYIVEVIRDAWRW